MAAVALSAHSLDVVRLMIETENLTGLFDEMTVHPIARKDLDGLQIAESEMLKAAKVIASLQEVKLLEGMVLDRFLQVWRNQNNLPMVEQFSKIKEFKHLITVPNGHNQLAAHPIYKQAFSDSGEANFQTLQKIYELAWRQLRPQFGNGELNLVILEGLKDFHFPSYALDGILNGLVRPCADMRGLALPFGLDEEQLLALCAALKGKILPELYLSLKSPLSNTALEQFIECARACKIQKMTLNNLSPSLRLLAREIADEIGLALTLT